MCEQKNEEQSIWKGRAKPTGMPGVSDIVWKSRSLDPPPPPQRMKKQDNSESMGKGFSPSVLSKAPCEHEMDMLMPRGRVGHWGVGCSSGPRNIEVVPFWSLECKYKHAELTGVAWRTFQRLWTCWAVESWLQCEGDVPEELDLIRSCLENLNSF